MEIKELLKIEAGNFEIFDTISTQLDYQTLKTNIASKLSTNEVELKNIIMKNSELIVNLFNNTKNLKEELFKSKRTLEFLESQITL